MTVSEFFAMGGFGFYIWTSFGIALLLMIVELLMLKTHRSAIIKRLQRLVRARKQPRTAGSRP